MVAQSGGHLYNVPSNKLPQSKTTLTASIWQTEGGGCTQLEKLMKQFLQIKDVNRTLT